MASTRILLVEDDSALNRLIRRYLEQQGHSVNAFELGEDAWREFSANGDAYDLAIVDLTLPDLPGEVLVSRVRQSSPSTPVLIASGFTDPGTFRQDPRVSFLQKPFLPAALAESVERALGG